MNSMLKCCPIVRVAIILSAAPASAEVPSAIAVLPFSSRFMPEGPGYNKLAPSKNLRRRRADLAVPRAHRDTHR